MKYYESKFTKFVGSAGFYVIIACCLIGIGAASWFAVSRYNSSHTENRSGSSENSGAYSKEQSSYNSSEIISSQPAPSASESVAKSVSDEPYTSDTQTPSEIAAEYFAVPVEGEISKGYSDTELQYSATYGDMRLHTGADIVCEAGSAVNAAGDGKVESVAEDMSYGTVITINHGNGIIVKYCGIADVTVKSGDTVKLGEAIGNAGTVPSECADQNHIHIEVLKDGKTVSPLKALGLG